MMAHCGGKQDRVGGVWGCKYSVGLSCIGEYEEEEGKEGHDTKVELIWGSFEPVSSGAAAGKPSDSRSATGESSLKYLSTLQSQRARYAGS